MSKEMYLHELNPVKGWWDEHALDKAAVVVLGQDEVVQKGQVMTLAATRKFQLGLACNAMPVFAFNTSTDQDAVMEAGSMVGPSNGGAAYDDDVASMTGLVAIGGYELESTEFDDAETASLVPNAFLTAGLPGAADAGVLKLGTPFTDTICGVCSDGYLVNEAKVGVIRFWGYFLPVADCAADSSDRG